MAMRFSEIISDTQLADSESPTKDLSKEDWISAILIEYYGQNGATNNESAHPHDLVPSMQVLDGSYVLKSLTGPQAAAMYLYDFGRTPPEFLDESPSVYQRAYFAILFGRYIGDPYFAINAKDFDNLQLKFTHNLATVRAVGATGYLTGSARWTVHVVRFEGDSMIAKLNRSPEQGGVQGWIKTEQKKSQATLASGELEVGLPVDHEWRRALVRSFITNNTLGIDRVTVDMGDGKFKPIDNMLIRQLRAQNRALYNLHPEVHQRLYKQNADTYESDIYDTLKGGLRHTATGGHILTITENYGLCTLALIDDAGAAIVADEAMDVANMGDGYQNTFMVPFDMGGEFLDARQWGGAEMNFNQTGAGRAFSLVLDEIIRGRGKEA